VPDRERVEGRRPCGVSLARSLPLGAPALPGTAVRALGDRARNHGRHRRIAAIARCSAPVQSGRRKCRRRASVRPAAPGAGGRRARRAHRGCGRHDRSHSPRCERTARRGGPLCSRVQAAGRRFRARKRHRCTRRRWRRARSAGRERCPGARLGGCQRQLHRLGDGYRPDFSWLRVPVFDGGGWPVHTRGVTAVRGLCFVGLPWLYKRKSALLLGVGEDADHVVSAIAGDQSHAGRIE
jgi:hypothetical protein